MLERQKLRAQVLEILTGRTNAEDKVTSGRITLWDADNLPAINIVTPQERNSGLAASHIPAFDTVLTLNIEISVAATDGWDNELDDICEQVEDLLLKNPDFLKGYSEIGSYTTNLSYEAGEMPIATAVMAFDLNYKQSFEPILEDKPFKTAHVKLPAATEMAEEDIIQARFERDKQ